jgi:hypothetical protein
LIDPNFKRGRRIAGESDLISRREIVVSASLGALSLMSIGLQQSRHRDGAARAESRIVKSIVLDDLHRLDISVREQISLPAYYGSGLEAIGLNLGFEPYGWCTPRNCKPFAHTGGNGVHFSLLEIPSGDVSLQPVVMTNPAAAGASLIVGENLRDFLSLGYHCGFFIMEQLSYDLARTLCTLVNPQHPEADPDLLPEVEKQPVLAALRKEFHLAPWADESRFDQLQKTYQPLLILPPGLM